MITMKVSSTDLSQYAKKYRQRQNEALDHFIAWLKEEMTGTLGEIKSEFPKKSGKTAEGITLEVGHGYFALRADSMVVLYIEHGTSAHGPVTAKALHFFIDDKEIFTRWVQGIQPHNIIKRASQRLFQRLQEAVGI